MKKDLKKEFTENRTSWKWFERQMQIRHETVERMHTKGAFLMRVQLEILKELQFMNDRTK